MLELPPPSPCQPPKYNEDEPEVVDDGEERLTPVEDDDDGDESVSTDSECDNYFASLADDDGDGGESGGEITRENPSDAAAKELEHSPLPPLLDTMTPGVSRERDISEIVVRTRAYRSNTLRKEFTEYLEAHNMGTPSNENNASVLETSAASVTSSVISNEARQILNGELGLSDSMLAVMNGDDPEQDGDKKKEQEKPSAAPVTPSVLTPVDVDSFLSDITEETAETSSTSADKENTCGSFVSAKSELSTCASSSALPAPPSADIPAPIFGAESHVATSCIVLKTGEESLKKRTRKRRSLTESAETNAMAQGKSAGGNSGATPPKRSNNIYFETDL